MGDGRGATNSQKRCAVAWPEGASSPPLSGHCIWRRQHSTTPQVLAKKVLQVISQPPHPAPWTPKLPKTPRVHCAPRTAARSPARGEKAGSWPWPGDAHHALATPLRLVPSRAFHCAVPGVTPAASCLGPFRVRVQARSVTPGHRGPSGKLKACPPSRLRSGTGFERHFI